MLEFSIIPESKFDEVIDHLRMSFPDEPLNAAVGLCFHGIPCPLLEGLHLKAMKDGISIMAIDKETNVLVGVALNAITKLGDIEKSNEELKECDHVPFRRIYGLLNDVNAELDLYKKYNVDKMFDIQILTVESKFRGKGLGKEIFAKCEDIARKNGFKLMKTDATSTFTARLAEKCGYKVEKVVKYHEYKDENGQLMYPTKPPHLHYTVLTKVLD